MIIEVGYVAFVSMRHQSQSRVLVERDLLFFRQGLRHFERVQRPEINAFSLNASGNAEI